MSTIKQSEHRKKVSVCMATCNGSKFIESQLKSILPQLEEEDEVIISDDCSTDGTVDIIKSLNDKRIFVLKANFQNYVKNFENALSSASGEIIFLSDQDDVWRHDRVSRIMELLMKYDLVVSDAEIIDGESKILNKSIFELIGSGKGILKNFMHNSYIGCCMAFNKSILSKALPFSAKIPAHDWWIGMISEFVGKIYFCNEKLVFYRRHSSNKTFTGNKSRNTIYDKIKYRYILGSALISRLLKEKFIKFLSMR
ncbi:MAG: glycosyltransferase family 2 protein [Nitrospiraceae bacterium]|nr:glycosyltransferase family 2 protein [Nitrospiraceae bacterium]